MSSGPCSFILCPSFLYVTTHFFPHDTLYFLILLFPPLFSSRWDSYPWARLGRLFWAWDILSLSIFSHVIVGSNPIDGANRSSLESSQWTENNSSSHFGLLCNFWHYQYRYKKVTERIFEVSSQFLDGIRFSSTMVSFSSASTTINPNDNSSIPYFLSWRQSSSRFGYSDSLYWKLPYLETFHANGHTSQEQICIHRWVPNLA